VEAAVSAAATALARRQQNVLSSERYGDQQLRRRACPEFVADRAMILMLLEVILFNA
jgi:hypothetical protein